ncbi:MAG: UDP-N-acetylglucosamine 1-carboxyvinyltransferase [Pseudomonadota bacterium]|nr:UDP-N-acetylglucosamine 1-carboxyvinyltransferase [Pseudomonadota bacterium]
MDKIRIIGGAPLKGVIPISGAKNAALPLMAACLLTDETLHLANVPYLADIVTMAKLLAQHGVALNTSGDGNRFGRMLSLNAAQVTNFTAPYELVRTMRASVLVLGPLLARFGQARVSLPGGCAIGTRPIDMHLKALQEMGAEIDLQEGYIDARISGRLKGAVIQFDKVSVGATENILMSASLAKGETVIRNAAREPEVCDLAHCLVAMGAKIDGIGSDEIAIQGVESLHGCPYTIIADRVETGSFAAAAAITGGDVELLGARAEHLQAVIATFAEAGIEISETPRGLRVRRANGRVQGVDIMTQPYPAFPPDMQAQMMALLSVAEGASMVTETIFENRFMHVPELTRMGARIVLHGASAMIRGVPQLRGAEVMATDLRASVSLAIAALAAEGETVIHRVYHLDRGYERLEEKLSQCGAQIERLPSGKPTLKSEAA